MTFSYEELLSHHELALTLLQADFCPNYPVSFEGVSINQASLSYLQNAATIVYHSTPFLAPSVQSVLWLRESLTKTKRGQNEYQRPLWSSSLLQAPSLALRGLEKLAKKAYEQRFWDLMEASVVHGHSQVKDALALLPKESLLSYRGLLSFTKHFRPSMLSYSALGLSVALETYRVLKERGKKAFESLQAKLKENPESGVNFCHHYLLKPEPCLEQLEKEGREDIFTLCLKEGSSKESLREALSLNFSEKEKEDKAQKLQERTSCPFTPSLSFSSSSFFSLSDIKGSQRVYQLYLQGLCSYQAPSLSLKLNQALLKL